MVAGRTEERRGSQSVTASVVVRAQPVSYNARVLSHIVRPVRRPPNPSCRW